MHCFFVLHFQFFWFADQWCDIHVSENFWSCIFCCTIRWRFSQNWNDWKIEKYQNSEWNSDRYYEFEKNIFCFFFINYYVQHCVHESLYKLTLILTSNDVVLHQWVKALQHFPNMKILMTHEEKALNIKHDVTFITISAMRDVSVNLTHWFKKFRYVFDFNDSRTIFIIILSIYEIFVSRTLLTETEKWNNKKNWITYKFKWKNIFIVAVFDEAYKFRHFWTRIYVSIRNLNVSVHWCLTVTFIVNNSFVNDQFHFDMKLFWADFVEYFEHITIFMKRTSQNLLF